MKKKSNSRELPPPGTLAVWFAHTGEWMHRKDLYVATNRDVALAWMKDNPQRGMRVSAAHIIRIRGRWYKMLVRPVACHVPTGWSPTDGWLRKALDIEVPEPPRTYVVTHVPKPKAFTWRERMRILFTGFPL